MKSAKLVGGMVLSVLIKLSICISTVLFASTTSEGVMGQQDQHPSVRKPISSTELTSLKLPFQISLILR